MNKNTQKKVGVEVQRRTNLQVSSLIIMLSIITIVLQFAAYYFFEAAYIVWGISCIVSIISCHIILQQAASYEAAYCFSLLTIFISLAITIVVYLGEAESFLPYTGIMTGIVIINWLLPLLHCIIRYIFDYSTRVEDFYIFYRNISIIFLVFYLGLLLYAAFTPDVFSWAYPIQTEGYNILPFEKLATLIENYLYKQASLGTIATYLMCRILIYMPYGFYLRLVLFNRTRITRLIVFMLLPLLVELVQFLVIPTRCDIDDIVYAALGAFFGSLSFFLFNSMVKAISGRDFLVNNTSHYSHSSLYF